jgi:hypothetical protein
MSSRLRALYNAAWILVVMETGEPGRHAVSEKRAFLGLSL